MSQFRAYGMGWTEKATRRLQEAEMDRAKLMILMAGISPTLDQMERIHELAEMVLNQPDPGAFVRAVAAMLEANRVPVMMPCSCVVCRFRRWVRGIFKRTL